MADRGRDLKIAVLSDVSQFDLDEPARQLDRMSVEADGVADALDDLDRAALTKLQNEVQDAGTDMDKLAKDAKDTASKVDSAFDKIAKSSKSGLGKVDDDAKKAGAGLDEFKDESASTSREAAASFGGVEDGLSAIQEVAANAFTGFGPAGAAAGLAVAGGLGLAFSALQSAADKANEAKDRIIGVAQAIRDVGGNLEAANIPGLLEEWAFAIGDNKSWWELWQKDNTTNLELFRDKAKAAGISVKEMFDAMTGTDPVALAHTLDELNAKIIATADADRGTRRELIETKQAIIDKAGETESAIQLEADAAEALGRTTDAQAAATEATKAAADALAGHTAALDAFVEPAGIYTTLLADKTAAEQASAQATADATKDQSDSWEDYAEDVKVSVGEYIAELERQVTAQEDWSSNLGKLAKRGVSEGVLAELEKMGPEGAPLVAKLTTASDKELAKLVALFDRQGKAAATATAAGIVANTGKVTTAAERAHAKAAAALEGRIDVPVGVTGAGSAAAEAHREMERYFRNNPVKVALTPGPGFRVNGRKVT